MNVRVLLATVAGAITAFVVGYLIFGLLTAPYVNEVAIQYAGLYKVPPDFTLLFLKNIVQAFLLVFIFEYLAGIRTFLGGLKNGAIIMFLVTLSVNLSLMSVMNLNTGVRAEILDVLGETVRFAISGGVIGAVLGLMNKKAETAGQ
jgi:hypothetical protein